MANMSFDDLQWLLLEGGMPADSTEDQIQALLPFDNESPSTLDSGLYSDGNIPSTDPFGQIEGYNFEQETKSQPQGSTTTAIPEDWLNLLPNTFQISSPTGAYVDDWLDLFQSPPEFES